MKADYNQTYTFYTSSDDGVRLWIDNALIIDKWIPQSQTEWSGTIALSPGNHDIVLEYFEESGGAMVNLSWSSPSVPKAIIPADHLYYDALCSYETPPAGQPAKATQYDALGQAVRVVNPDGTSVTTR